ncbi:MAG: PHP domain-containing protein [Treponema sp.]|nr:PHP domain-containing protein [Treponema sp.]
MENKITKTVDLHIHSTYSDGSFSVEEIIKNAKNIGLTTISITDHDTIEQIPDCITFGKKYDITVIPGIELSCIYKIAKDKNLIMTAGSDFHSPDRDDSPELAC